MLVDNLDGDIRWYGNHDCQLLECVEGIIGMVRYIKKKRVETSRRGVAMGDIEKEIHILAEMENENIIYLHQVHHHHYHHPPKDHQPLTSNAQFVILLIELLR